MRLLGVGGNVECFSILKHIKKYKYILVRKPSVCDATGRECFKVRELLNRLHSSIDSNDAVPEKLNHMILLITQFGSKSWIVA